MTYKLSKNSIKNMTGVDMRLCQIARLAIEITTVDFGIPSTGGVRSDKQQNELYLDGKSKCDGYNKKSKHQEGKALDVFAYVDGKASWDEMDLTMVAVAFFQAANMLGYKIEWGGLWEFKDMPHFQIVD